MKKWIAGMTAFAALGLAGCGDGEGDASDKASEATPSAPAEVIVNVTLKDSVPFQVLWNHDDTVCRSVDVVAKVFKEDTTPVEVVLRDADGSIVASEILEETGGSVGDGTCTWPLAFTVDHSDFYEATVTWHDGTKTATGQTAHGGASVEVVL